MLATSLRGICATLLVAGSCTAMVKLLIVSMSLAVFRRQPNDQREMPVASVLVEVARRLPADRGLNRRIDVAGREPIARGCLAVDIDAQRRLAERGEYRKVGHAAYVAHGVLDLLRDFRQHDEVVADQLDRVLTFDAGDRFLDVVLDVLREVEARRREIAPPALR